MSRTDSGFELIEQLGVIVVNGLYQARDQYLPARVRLRKEMAHELRGATLLYVLHRNGRRVEKGAPLLCPPEQPSAERPVECRHDGGVGKAAIELFGNLLHSRAAQCAQDCENVALAMTEKRGGRTALRGTACWLRWLCHPS